MTTSRRSRAIGVGLLALAVAVSGCGLKSEVKDSLAQASTGVVDPGSGATGTTGSTDSTGSGAATGTGAVSTSGSAASGTTAGATGSSGAGTSTAGTAGSTSGTSGSTSGTTTGGGSTTGIKGSVIHVTLVAPLTGASPLPQQSFESGWRKYWNGRKVQGRYTVEVKVEDDKYNPNGAVQACRRGARDSFVVIGSAGTDQIQACARDSVLRRTNTPYLSAGVTTNGLEGIPNYFAFSLTYKQQSETVVRMAKQAGFFKAGDTWALVLSGTPNFEDAKTSMEAALKAAGVKTRYFAAPKAGGDAAPIASQLAAGRFPVVYFLGQPLYFADLVGKTNNATYAPYWVGPGVSMGVNSIATLTCGRSPQFDGKGYYLGPYPGLDKAPQVAPGQTFGDDIEMLIYGLMQLLDQSLQLVKGQLTRESLIAAMAAGQIPGGVFTGSAWRGQTHFGGTKAYILRANCSQRRWNTFGGPIA